MDIKDQVAAAIADIQEDEATNLISDSLAQGVDAKLLLDGVIAGLQEVGHRFETQEYFMLELMEAGELGKNLIATITPHLPKMEGIKKGKVVIGSSRGDIHDIGKNLVITQLELAGFEVIDLGVDVPSMTFIDKARESGADIIAMSAFLTTTMAYFSEVIQYLKDMGLRDQFYVLVGGGTTNAEFAASIGADGTAPDAVKALKLCEKLMADKGAK